jgi:hypothetical protein
VSAARRPGSTSCGGAAPDERRGRKLRGTAVLLRPYRGRSVLMFGRAAAATAAALAPPPLAKLAIDDGHHARRLATLELGRRRFVASRSSTGARPTRRRT